MGLLTKLKSLLGLDDDRSTVRQTDSGVTIEREPGESPEPDAETESAVKGVDDDDAAAGTVETEDEATELESDAEADAESSEGTDDAVDATTAPEAEDPDAQIGGGAADPGDVTQPSTEAGQPVQTEDTEPEPTPEPTDEAVGDEDEEAEELVEEAETEAGAESTDEGATAEAETTTIETDEAETAAEPDDETTTEPESDADAAADEPVGDGEPLDDIKGIGPAYAERLRDAGVPDIAALAKADAEQLALETGLSEKRITSWIDRAKAR